MCTYIYKYVYIVCMNIYISICICTYTLASASLNIIIIDIIVIIAFILIVPIFVSVVIIYCIMYHIYISVARFQGTAPRTYFNTASLYSHKVCEISTPASIQCFHEGRFLASNSSTLACRESCTTCMVPLATLATQDPA